MKEYIATDGRRIVLHVVSAASHLSLPFTNDLFVAMVWICDDSGSTDIQMEFAKALITSGCRYIVFGGVNCEAWHDHADLVWVELNIESGLENDIPFVMTSWHTDAPDEDVVFFTFNCTNFDEHYFQNFLILMVGNDENRRRSIDRCLQVSLTDRFLGQADD